MTPAGRGAGNRDHVALAPAAARRSAGGWLAAWAGCLLSLCGHRVAEAQEFQYTEITLSQYDAQKDYAGWQKTDDNYEKFQWDEGYAECIDDPNGYLAAASSWTCDVMPDLLGCEYTNLTEIFADQENTVPENTTVEMLCPKACNGCKKVSYFPFLAVIRSTDLCSMCAQGSDTTFKMMEGRHCREAGERCFPRWRQGCPKGCSQWVDRRRVIGTNIWAYLTEDGKWYVLDIRVCDSLERWEYPVIDAKDFQIRVSQVCRDPAKDVTPIRPIFQGVVMKWEWHYRLHYEFRVQSDLQAIDRGDEELLQRTAAAIQANIIAQQEAAALGR